MTLLFVIALAVYFTSADAAATQVVARNRRQALAVWFFAVLGVATVLFALGLFVVRALLSITGEALLLSILLSAILYYRRARRARVATTL